MSFQKQKNTELTVVHTTRFYANEELKKFGEFLGRFRVHKLFPLTKSEGDIVDRQAAMFAYGVMNEKGEIKGVAGTDLYREFWAKYDQWIRLISYEREQEERSSADYQAILKSRMQVAHNESDHE